MNSNTKKSVGKEQGNGFYTIFGRDGQPVKVYVPSKEDDEENE